MRIAWSEVQALLGTTKMRRFVEVEYVCQYHRQVHLWIAYINTELASATVFVK